LLICFLLQHFMLALKKPLERIIKVDQDMKPIRNLKRSWSAFSGSLRVGSCSVTADDFNPRISGEPGFQRLSLSVRQDIHNVMSFQVNEECAIGLPLADGPIVHSKHAWGRSSRNGSTAEQTEQRVSTDRHLHVLALPSRRSASQFFGDGTESAGLSIGATSMGHRYIDKWLGKGFACTSSIGAEKSTHLDAQPDGIVHQRDICQDARIATVNFHRFLSTVRAGKRSPRRANGQKEDLALTSHLLKQEVRARRKQQGG